MRFERGGTLTRALLISVGIAGLAVAAITAPNIARALLPYMKSTFSRTPHERSLLRTLQALKKRRMLRFIQYGDATMLEITEQGRRRLREFEFDSMAFPLPKRWSGQWTVILFDIPEGHKKARDALREKLKQLGCFPYNRSVFVHPTDCGDEIDFVAEFFDVGRYVAHFRTSSLGKQEYRAVQFFGVK